MLSFSLFEKKLETLVSIKEEESITLVQLLFSYPESEPTAWVIFPRNTTMRSPCLLPSHSLQLNWVPLFSEIFFQSSVPVKMPEVCYIIGRQQERTLAEIDIFPHPSRFSSTKLKLCKCDASQDCFLFFSCDGSFLCPETATPAFCNSPWWHAFAENENLMHAASHSLDFYHADLFLRPFACDWPLFALRLDP